MRPLLLFVTTGFSLALTLGCAAETDAPVVASTGLSNPGEREPLLRGKVVKVIDGATIDVEADGRVYRVRYLGIDMPENDRSDGRSLSERAYEFNRFLVEGRTVELERGDVEADRMGNLLRYVYADGESVNKTMINNGYAVVADSPTAFRYRTEFLIAETSARASSRGVWEPSAAQDGGTGPPVRSTPAPVPLFSGGTLPALPSPDRTCEYSGTSEPVIKGNIDSRSGERTYHMPGSLLYSTTRVDEARGDRWFCTEEEALAGGWSKSKR